MSSTVHSFTHTPIHTNDPQTPNSQIATNKAGPPSSSVVERLHEHTWFTYQIDETHQFRVTTVLDTNRKWKVDARDWYWDKSGEWRRAKVGGCFRCPYGIHAAAAVLQAAHALREHGAPMDGGVA